MIILVAIANHGWKNQVYLDRLIREYQSMSYKVDIVVLSDIPKDLGKDIEVRVGAPTSDPWSLPFPHKEIFADRLNEYDLFIYSEDDTLITQRSIDAFLEVTEVLPEDKIAGFLRYEKGMIDEEPSVSLPDIHGHYHWKANSVESWGKYKFAYFTNEHAACYIMTRNQLSKAIESGGYLVEPHQGRYDLLCTAATDPYTQCGFTKVVCISHIQDFLAHHLPNVYVGRLGINWSELQLQINALLSNNGEKKSQSELLPVTTNSQLNLFKWNKHYYGKCEGNVLTLIPNNAKNVLSVGCGWGATEAKLVQKKVRVVGIPIDSIIAESAKSRGIEVLCPDLEIARETIRNEIFDCILFIDILEYLHDPVRILSEYTKLLRDDGCAVITILNVRYIKYFYKIFFNRKVLKERKTFDKIHIYCTALKLVGKWFNQSGLKVVRTKYIIDKRFKRLGILPLGPLRKYLAPSVLFVTNKSP